ncbi:MAG: sugar phosphate isomerase/epimerase family protein [Pirellulales bacterium]
MAIDRRQFAAALAASSFGALLTPPDAWAAKTVAPGRNPICCFAKPLQHLSFDALADQMAEMGFQGIEATVRKGGQVDPAQVQDDLPKLAEALKQRGLEITIMASDVNSVEQQGTQQVLRVAAALGIKFYRMKYFRYDRDRPITRQLQEIRPRMKSLAALNRELGITALYHNHSGSRYVGSMLWDVHGLLEGIPPSEIGLAYDIRHAVVEAGLSWPIGFRLVRPQIRAVCVKDFRWQGERPKNVPLGDGRVGKSFFKLLKQSDFKGPLSLHMEYIDHRDPALIEQSLQAIAHDLKVLKSFL